MGPDNRRIHEEIVTFKPKPRKLRILAIEPYLAPSHRAFLEGFQAYSRHRVEIWSLPPRAWKWRMRGSAIHFADRARAESTDVAPDCILASDYLNLCDWRALAPARFSRLPTVFYFHENQATFPLSPDAPRDVQHGWTNLTSALAAEKVLFNSSYHREEFLDCVEQVLRRMPDFVPHGLPEKLRAKSDVFPVGIDFAPHRLALQRSLATKAPLGRPPTIVWNHRWEPDKGPDRLAEALLGLKARGCDFRLVLCGQDSSPPPASFSNLAAKLGKRVLHMGFIESHDEYLEMLTRCDIVLSTARHEFFGVAVVEAIFLGCLPVLPAALSYPELLPPELHSHFLYESKLPLDAFLERFLEAPPKEHGSTLRRSVERFDWKHLAARLDDLLESVEEGR